MLIITELQEEKQHLQAVKILLTERNSECPNGNALAKITM
jgi:hypothetical protein